MYKAVLFVFLLCFVCYLPFSRQPDFFDSEYIDGVVVKVDAPDYYFVRFTPDLKKYYKLRIEGVAPKQKTIKLIYNTGNPKYAAVYKFWGYWVGWAEILSIVIGYFVLLELAKAVTSNPHPDAIKELEEEERKPKIRKPRYNP